jgi:hypothetical protein
MPKYIMHASNNYSPSFNHRYEAEEQAEIVKKKSHISLPREEMNPRL